MDNLNNYRPPRKPQVLWELDRQAAKATCAKLKARQSAILSLEEKVRMDTSLPKACIPLMCPALFDLLDGYHSPQSK
jgi:hypothetical protein